MAKNTNTNQTHDQRGAAHQLPKDTLAILVVETINNGFDALREALRTQELD
jgi:hypothetical protein